ncbi:GTPase-activating of the rho rac family (LRG1) [Fusarium phyllophilum]|uniref:GTPase-activating of the rho rac family (LRG1) n=1 Tax=Fusarium phyllophilum TaxID=47803 RepID=A0A8H5K529_9HYPO|nr:GTPase-activating of the rho rac family (LRG1) [Fusarium phyllophilum]
MDPLSIATSVVGLTATCLSTCKKLHDLAGEYEDVPTTIAMICSESTVISMGLSELQSKILHRDDLAQAWASRTDILNVFEVALTGCMTVFSCLEAETRNLKLRNPGVLAKLPGVLAKLKFIWNQDRLKELLEALRGQQTSITFLLNILEMDTLSNIQKDIRQHTRHIEATAAEAQSLQSRIPSIKIESQSIFDKGTSRLSLFEATSNLAPSELDFQFDDLVINSNAYRRAFAKAHTERLESKKQAKDQHDDSGSATPNIVNFQLMTASRDTPRGISQISLCDTTEAPTGEEGLSPESQTRSPQEATKEERHQAVSINGSDLQVLFLSQAVSQLVCNKCSVDITGRCVTALGYAWHPNCFVCYDCGEPVAGHFFPSNEEGNQDKPLCEKDYTRRLDSKCFKCNEALTGSYITTFREFALEQSHHPEHLTCEECDTLLSIESYHSFEKRVYCELHYCRNLAHYCGGCKFPLLLDTYYLEAFDRAGVKRNWHSECLIMTQYWGVQIPVSHKGRQYLTAIQSGSMHDLIPEIRKQHITCLQRIYQLGSYILSTFTENLYLALMFRTAGVAGHESFRYWRIMLFAASRLFQAAAQLSNDVRTFSRTFHGVLTDIALGSNDPSYVVTEKIVVALRSVLRVALNTLLEMDRVSWDAMHTELDNFLKRLDFDIPLVSNPDYDRKPTGRGVFLRCDECNEILLHDAFAESSEAGHKWHPECFRCHVCRGSEGVVSSPVLQATGSYKCQLESCGWEGIIELIPSNALIIHNIWRSWLLVKKQDPPTNLSPEVTGFMENLVLGIQNRYYPSKTRLTPS